MGQEIDFEAGREADVAEEPTAATASGRRIQRASRRVKLSTSQASKSASASLEGG